MKIWWRGRWRTLAEPGEAVSKARSACLLEEILDHVRLNEVHVSGVADHTLAIDE